MHPSLTFFFLLFYRLSALIFGNDGGGKEKMERKGPLLMLAQLYLTLANVVRRNEFVLYETSVAAVKPAREFLLPRAADGTHGVRVKVV